MQSWRNGKRSDAGNIIAAELRKRLAAKTRPAGAEKHDVSSGPELCGQRFNLRHIGGALGQTQECKRTVFV
jgi:hypothetical protein